MNFERKELIAILKSIKYFADADQSINKDDMEYFGKFLKDNCLPLSSIKEATDMKQHEMYHIITQFNDEKKSILKSYWIEAIYADGMVSMEDLDIIAIMSVNYGINVNIDDLYSL